MQTSAELIDVAGWARDEDFAIFPVGSKPKRALICPSPSPYPFLIEGHRYMFKVSTGWRIFQHWSEVIAYRISTKISGPVCAPCFIAWDSTTGEVGVVVEFFYGHPRSGVPARFVAGADLMRRVFEDFDSDTDSTHTWQNIQLICRAFSVQNRVAFWAKLLAFDALIGNTDRHSENWGLLALRIPGTRDGSRWRRRSITERALHIKFEKRISRANREKSVTRAPAIDVMPARRS